MIKKKIVFLQHRRNIMETKEKNKSLRKKRVSKKSKETAIVELKNLSKAGIWRRTKYVEGEIFDMRAVLK
jgi:hypothetical protein